MNIEKKEVNVSCAEHKFLNIQSVTPERGDQKFQEVDLLKALFMDRIRNLFKKEY